MIEMRQLLVGSLTASILFHLFKAGQSALGSSHSRYLRHVAAKQPLILQNALIDFKKPSVEEVDKFCEVFLKILEIFLRYDFSKYKNSTGDDFSSLNNNESDNRNVKLLCQLAADAMGVVLDCLECGLSSNA